MPLPLAISSNRIQVYESPDLAARKNSAAAERLVGRGPRPQAIAALRMRDGEEVAAVSVHGARVTSEQQDFHAN
jgi:hypothetical protein